MIAPEEGLVLSNLEPGPTQTRLALGLVLTILVVSLLVMGPFVDIHPGAVGPLLPIYLSVMFVVDLITSVLLFSQFSILRSRALLVIANAYIFTALIMILSILSFPGVFLPGQGVIGKLQTTAWLYVLWHCGFAAFVFAYAWLQDLDVTEPYWQSAVRPILLSLALTIAGVAVAGFICIAVDLPGIMLDISRYSSMWPYYVGLPIAVFCTTALVMLWTRRRTVLVLWLMVVMWLYLVEIPLSYYPIPKRFGLGWYTVRGIGFISSSLVLVVLLSEITMIYGRLLRAIRAQRQEREARLITADAVAATIVHEVKQPLSGMVTSAEAGLRFINRPIPDLGEAKEAFTQIVADGRRATQVIGGIRSLFTQEGRSRVSLDLNKLIKETIALVEHDLEKHQITVVAELEKQLPPVNGDQIQLQQLLINLITNAIESMAATEEPGALSVRSEIREGRDVTIMVADTGTGIGSEDLDRVFNPLFTTKQDGMGMGLSICRSIAEAHDGRLWFSPNTPRGAVFYFSLAGSASA